MKSGAFLGIEREKFWRVALMTAPFDCGMWKRAVASKPSRDILILLARSLGIPMAKPLLAVPAIAPCDFGIQLAASVSTFFLTTAVGFGLWLGVQMGSIWPAALKIARCDCGMLKLGRA
jgi:hypothetical protein